MKSYIIVLKQFSDFKTRTRRKEFWMFTLFSAIISGILTFFAETGLFGGIYSLLILVPSLAVGVRRLHDVGKSGWMLLIALIPLIGAIWLVILFCKDSQPKENKWGSKPIEDKEDKVWYTYLYFGLGVGLFVLPILKALYPLVSYNDFLIYFPSFLTLVLIFAIVYFIRQSQYKRDVNELDKIKLQKKPEPENEEPSVEGNILANRTFQHKNFIGAKTTWNFNEKGNKVTIKAGMFGINTVNTTISFEDLGERRYKAKGLLGAQIFKLKDDCIITGPVVLNEIN